jgi:hypothetical protein
MALATAGIEPRRYLLSFNPLDLTLNGSGSLVSSPLAGEGQGGGYSSHTEASRGLV